MIQTKALSYSSNPEGFISEVIDEAKVILSSSSSSKEKAKKLALSHISQAKEILSNYGRKSFYLNLLTDYILDRKK